MPKCEGTTGCHCVGAGGLAGGAVGVGATSVWVRRRLLLWRMAPRVLPTAPPWAWARRCRSATAQRAATWTGRGPPAPARSPTAGPAGRRCRRRWPPGGGLRRPDSRKPALPRPPQQAAAPRRRPAPRQGRSAPRRLRDRRTPAHRPPWRPPRSARGGAPFPATPVGAASSTLRGCPACPAGRGRRRSPARAPETRGVAASVSRSAQTPAALCTSTTIRTRSGNSRSPSRSVRRPSSRLASSGDSAVATTAVSPGPTAAARSASASSASSMFTRTQRDGPPASPRRWRSARAPARRPSATGARASSGPGRGRRRYPPIAASVCAASSAGRRRTERARALDASGARAVSGVRS